MHSHLSAAFAEASKLPLDQQEIFAAFLLSELNDEAAWLKSFNKSENMLSAMAKGARDEYQAGTCKPLEDLLD